MSQSRPPSPVHQAPATGDPEDGLRDDERDNPPGPEEKEPEPEESDDDEEEQTSSSEQPPSEPSGSKIKYGLYLGLAASGGFFDGLVGLPERAIAQLIDEIPGQPESAAKSILLAPLRMLWELLKAPIDAASDWFSSHKKSYLAEDHKEHLAELKLAKKQQPPFSFLGFLVGFIAGWVKAPFIALNAIFNTPREEDLFLSFLYAPFRFLSAFLATPFRTASEWGRPKRRRSRSEPPPIEENREFENQHRKLSGSEFLYAGFYGLAGFVVGCSEALWAALDSAVNTPVEESFFKSFFMALPRFLSKLVLKPFEKANEWVESYRDELDHEITKIESQGEEEENTDNSPPNPEEKLSDGAALQPNNFVGLLRVAFSGILGLIVGIALSPIRAFKEAFHQKSVLPERKTLMEALLSFPWAFIKALFSAPYKDAKRFVRAEKETLAFEAKQAQENPPKPRVQISGFTGHLAAFVKGFFGFALGALVSVAKALYDLATIQRQEPILMLLLKLPFRICWSIISAPFIFADHFARPEAPNPSDSAPDGSTSQIQRSIGGGGPTEDPDKAPQAIPAGPQVIPLSGSVPGAAPKVVPLSSPGSASSSSKPTLTPAP